MKKERVVRRESIVIGLPFRLFDSNKEVVVDEVAIYSTLVMMV